MQQVARAHATVPASASTRGRRWYQHEAWIAWLRQRGRPLPLEDGSIIVSAGVEPTDCLYFLSDGAVMLRFANGTTVLRFSAPALVPIERCAGVDMLPGSHIYAVTDCTVYEIRREHVLAFVERYSGGLQALLDEVALHLRALQQRLVVLATAAGKDRVLATLRELAGDPLCSRACHDGYRIDIPRRQLAALAHVDRSTCARSLRELQREGILQVDGDTREVLLPHDSL